ncbi:MAG TPA: glycosyltransferase family 2 protein [Verrucomicrobiales bacterium]|nr:glycosyltransferase family 2 protein [Verrucomicrobiales bacterium]
MSSAPDLTFVFPCLNEEKTLGICIERVKASLDPAGIAYEIVVADNGSTDRSREIAAAAGCRVVPVAARGYGAALKGGIEAALGKYAMFADSDSTYMYEHAAPLHEAAVKNDAGMAIASRMIGEIEPGAMPPLHRHLGTPVLTWLINTLFHGRLTDCNSGFRCVKKEEYLKWGIRSDGMEFASELLIKALKAGTKTVEIPSGLRCGPPDRVAHLRTWRDGMRHLLFILSERPALFEWLGLLLLVPATLLQILSAITGPVALGPFNVFDIHSQALLLMAGILGTQLYIFGCSLHLRGGDKPLRFTEKFIHLDEGTLFFMLLGVFTAFLATVGGLLIIWAGRGFAGLHQANSLLVAVHILGLMAMGGIGLLSIHTLKKARTGA